jgi:hypothetical protein
LETQESGLWKHVPYIRPSRRYDENMREFQEAAVRVHKRQAAYGRRRCPGCQCFMPKASRAARCLACSERYGSTAHWWEGLRGREKRTPRPSG